MAATPPGPIAIPAPVATDAMYDYNGLHLIHAMRSGYQPAAPTHLATHSLYNNSTGSDLLVVRKVTLGILGAQFIVSQLTQTLLGSSLGTVVRIMPNIAPGFGLHYYADTTTTITADFVFQTALDHGSWDNDFPVCVLPPGWALAVQCVNATTQLGVGFYWETVPAQILTQSL